MRDAWLGLSPFCEWEEKSSERMVCRDEYSILFVHFSLKILEMDKILVQPSVPSVQFSRSVVSYSFATPRTAACQASLPGASVRNSAHGIRSWGRKLGIRKGVIKPQETPCSRASTPQTRVLYGELSPITISLGEGVNLQLQVNKNSWAWQECFNLWTLKVLWPAWSGPAACDCLQPPSCERHGMF